MRALWFSVLVLLALVMGFAAGCDSMDKKVVRRDGPPFAQTFAGAGDLIATSDVVATRALLARAILPDEAAHHDALVAALADADSVDAEHLLLLTEAVYGQEFQALGSLGFSVSGGDATVTVNGVTFSVLKRGEGPYADVVDQLLFEGSAKLAGTVTPSEAGRMMGRSQTFDTLDAVASRVLPDADDGTADCLADLLSPMSNDDVRSELVIRILLPAGKLEGARADAAVEAMGFDDARQQVVEAVIDVRADVAIDDITRWMDGMGFDGGRRSVVSAATEKLGAVTGGDLARVVEMMAFDDGRLQIVDHLVPHLQSASFEDLLTTLDHFSFDSGRTSAIERLCASEGISVNASDLPRAIDLASFDSGRIEILRTVKPRLVDGVDAKVARALLDATAFDDGRIQLLTALKDHLEILPASDRESLLDTMAFDSGKERAREVLGL